MKKTHCIRGHVFAGDNLYCALFKGRIKRVCRECRCMHDRASYYRNRKPLKPLKTSLARFMEKVDKQPAFGCWLWTAAVSKGGYGRFGVDGGVGYAHRWVYEHFIGLVPEGLDIDHLCRVRNCVNPDHLEPVTRGENIRRGRSHTREKTHCPKGHPYSGENLVVHNLKNGKRCRKCRICLRKHAAEFFARRKERV